MAIEQVVKSPTYSGNVTPNFVRFSEVAHLLDKIHDYNLALLVAKWLAKQLHNGNLPKVKSYSLLPAFSQPSPSHTYFYHLFTYKAD